MDATIFVLAMCFATSCVTDGYVTYRVYPSEPHYYTYGYVPHTYFYVHPRPHYNHPFGYYHPKPHPAPHHNNVPHVQPPTTPPKPTSVPKATVRQHGNHGGGSMSGANRRR